MRGRAPSPRGHWLLGHIPQFRRDVLGGIEEAVREHGDVVRFRLGLQVVHVVNRPEYAAWVLQRQHGRYDKRTRSSRAIRRVTGESLLMAEGEDWQRSRRLLQPAFHHRSVAGFGEVMREAAEEWLRGVVSGGVMDFAAEMQRLTFTIAGRCLFRTDTAEDSVAMEEALGVILPETFARVGRVWSWPDWVPTGGNRRYAEALGKLDAMVGRIVAEHRRAAAGGEERDDVLGMLLRVREEGTGRALTDEELRNETVTFLIAGHETTANALAWTFHLLSRHPEVVEALGEEILEVAGGRELEAGDVVRLVRTRMAVKEAMRLYPPIWIIERRAREEDMVGGYRIPAGSSVIVCPWTLHRHPEFWAEPEEYRPERFAGGNPEGWIPFGAGPRFCIGSEFAMMEAVLITALILRRYRPEAAGSGLVEPSAGITLRVRGGLPMRLVARGGMIEGIDAERRQIDFRGRAEWVRDRETKNACEAD